MTEARESGKRSVVLRCVVARERAARGRAPLSLIDIDVEHTRGVLGIWGAVQDGTSLLFDVIDGTVRPSSGDVRIEGASLPGARPRVWRVGLEPALPERLKVSDVCTLSGKLRAEDPLEPAERLRPFALERYLDRSVRSLSRSERRALMLALALTSSSLDVLLVEEPLLAIEPLLPSLVVEALRSRGATVPVFVSSASARDVRRMADVQGAMSQGRFVRLPQHVTVESLSATLPATVHVVLTPPHGKQEASELSAMLNADPNITRVETHAVQGASASLLVSGMDRARLSHSLTLAIARSRVDVELIEVVAPVEHAEWRAWLVERAAATHVRLAP
jgi:ABC-type multidrug transport system ATPase subunit